MALSVAVQKNLADYEPKLIGKLTPRTLIAIVAGISCALLMGFYINFVICISIDEYGWLIIAASLPGWAIGFWKPDNMHPEEWLPLWFKHAMTSDVVTYTRTFDTADSTPETTKKQGKETRLVLKEESNIVGQLNRNGAELFSPNKYFVS